MKPSSFVAAVLFLLLTTVLVGASFVSVPSRFSKGRSVIVHEQQQLTASPAVMAANTASSSWVKEIFVPIGQGQTAQTTWTDIDGAEVTIDTTKYPPIDTVTFDVAMHTTPAGSGTSFARLYNVTDKTPVWFSDLQTSEVVSTHLESKAITLADGKKLYRVQMYALLNYPAILDFARMKVTLK